MSVLTLPRARAPQLWKSQSRTAQLSVNGNCLVRPTRVMQRKASIAF